MNHTLLFVRILLALGAVVVVVGVVVFLEWNKDDELLPTDDLQPQPLPVVPDEDNARVYIDKAAKLLEASIFDKWAFDDFLDALETLAEEDPDDPREVADTLRAFNIGEQLDRLPGVLENIDKALACSVLVIPPRNYVEDSPMRYKREERRVYAIGRDLEDNGGDMVRDRTWSLRIRQTIPELNEG